MQKQFFTKKLTAAEITVMQYNMLSDAINQLVLLYNRYEKNDTEIGSYLNDNLMKQIDEKILLANNASLSLSNAISLYFDLKSDFSKNEIISNFYNSLNSLAPFTENVENTYNQYLKLRGTKDEQIAWERYQKSEKDLGDEMTKISGEYQKFDFEIQKHISQIRKEMKKFEY
ncbi:hypothetical protein [Maribellus sp. YY47]|uniref:hypothetical protein n=1 Tax=Maribellus sp. YY47 TaxID=2929486 RepID=UPI002000A5E6|nr:hypothetical protein [Maribellus sp. YY47]MCK3685873.1 hypothetical protein [Maribellus sp. YY47]